MPNKTTRATKKLLDGASEEITRKMIKMALEGDPVAMRLCMERIHPRPKESFIKARLPEIKKVENIPQAMAEIFQMIGNGRITVDQGKTLAGIVVSQGNVLEMAELEKRISVLEEKQ